MGTHNINNLFGLSRLSNESDGTEKPCKACNAFKTWAKTQEKKVPDHAEECPLDKDELGRSTWGFLHTMAAYYPSSPSKQEMTKMEQFFNIFANFYPCNVCAVHFQEDIKKCPPEVKSADALSNWLCKMHNHVNVRLGKPVFDCSKVKERWKDGWKDGSCD